MKAVIDKKEFQRVIKALKPFTREYTNNLLMQYIYLEVNKDTDEIKFEALDGHRVAIEYLKCQADESFTAYIKPMQFWKTENEKVEIEICGEYAVADFGHYFLKYKQPEGTWFDTKKLISGLEAENPISRVGIDADLFMDALKNVKDSRISLRRVVIFETRGPKDAVIVRDENDRRNLRLVLPVNIYDKD